jgi:hypothetical protein
VNKKRNRKIGRTKIESEVERDNHNKEIKKDSVRETEI